MSDKPTLVTPTESSALIDVLKQLAEATKLNAELSRQSAVAAGPTKVKNGQESQVSPFNPTGNKKRKLNRRIYVHGDLLIERTLHDEEIALLNSDKLRPGLYIDELVTVSEVKNGNGVGEKDIHIDYSVNTPSKMLQMATLAPNFAAMLRRLTTEESK